MNNPFTLSFGRKPSQFISRITQTNHIIEVFTDTHPSSQAYMITGVRGSGKTVMMSTVSEAIAGNDDWIVVELNLAKDMLQSLAAKLYAIPELHALFLKEKLNLSVLGLGMEIANEAPLVDTEDAVGRMLQILKKQNKRLLVTIDEVTKNEFIREFAGSFQIFLRRDYEIYMLMTGLYENLYGLQNDKSLTFLYRTPKVILEPLNYTAIKKQYLDIFHISDDQAAEMAALTKGYPFAFQVLGYLYWEKSDDQNLDDILFDYDRYLEEYVYEKIWSECSDLDKKILAHIADKKEYNIKELRGSLQMSSQLFSVYRDRLKRKCIVDVSHYGKISLILPRFDLFIRRMYVE